LPWAIKKSLVRVSKSGVYVLFVILIRPPSANQKNSSSPFVWAQGRAESYCNFLSRILYNRRQSNSEEAIMDNKSAITQAKAHTPKLVLTQQAHKVVHGDNAVGVFNTRVAVKITGVVGSMWCAYAFALLALISLPSALRSGNSIIIVGWIAQTFLQLVLLPIIIVGQNVQAAASDARALSDHDTLLAIHTLTSEVHSIDEQQTKILNFLAERTNTLNSNDSGPTTIQDGNE